jgi:parallel beta-helix repeat protein
MRPRIVGEDRHSTIIDGGGTGSVISVTANNVDINGFTIQNSGSTSSDGGIYVISSGNNISHNTITNNKNGIYLYYSSNDNTIHHNNFINNTDQVWSDSVNVWNDDDEGNYWSDYAGQDLYGDGIGDAPYIIDVNNQDNHPLMGTFSNFTVTWKGENYHVTTICNSTISNFRFEIGPETGNKIIRFNVAGKDNTVGFCRVMTPTDLMNYPYCAG